MRKLVVTFTLFCISIMSVQANIINIDLDDLIEVGFEKNCELKMLRLDVEAAKKDIKIAKKLKNPEIQSNLFTGNSSIYNASQAGIVLPIEVLKRGVRKNIAQSEYNIKNTELKRAEHNYKLQIMKAYFDVLYAKSVCLIQQERLKLFKDLVQITTDKPKTYNYYQIDNLKADIQYAQQLIEVNRAKSTLMAKQFEMNKILNTGDDSVMYDTKEASLWGNWPFLSIKLPDYDFVENVALQYSYIVRISDEKIEKANQELVYAKRQRVPDISIGAGYSWLKNSKAPFDYGGAYLAYGMSLPILYNYSSDIQKAELFLDRSKVGKKAYEQQLKYQLKKDYNIFKYSAENMEHSKTILEDSKKIVKLTTDAYIKGKSSYSDLVINENGHQEVLSQYLNIMSKHFYSYLELMQDVGHDILIEEDLL